MKTVFIPNSVINLGPQVFSSCTGLVTLYIGNSIGTLDNSTFSGCTSLTDVYSYSTVAPPADSWVNNKKGIFSQESYEKVTLHVSAGSLDSYKATEPWSYFLNVVNLTDEELASGIRTVGAKDTDAKYIFTLDGKRHLNIQRGINIIGGKKYVVK